MSQVPLAPPPPTGGPLDSWLYLLWRRLTQAGQILWASITPGTSADVAAVVTDETGTAGGLVFSGNPTLQGVTVDGLAYIGDTTVPAGETLLGAMISTDTASGRTLILRKSVSAVNGPNFSLFKSRGTAASPTTVASGDFIGSYTMSGHDGTSYVQSAQILGLVDGTVSTGVVPSYIQILTSNASGTLAEGFRVAADKTVTLGGVNTAPALKVTPVASQARWIEVTGATSSGNPNLNTSAGSLELGSTGTTVVTINSNGNVGIGADPELSFTLELSSSAGGGPNIAMKKTGVPTIDSSMFAFAGYASNSSALAVGGTINFKASEGWTTTANGTYIQFRTVKTGTTTLAEGARMWDNGAFTAGGASTAPAIKVTPVASQARWVEVTGATSSANPTIGVSGGTLDITTSVAITGVVSTSGYTVATLPAGTVGKRAYVTDALGPAYGVAVVGGGAVTVPVFYNGAAWICA